MANGLFDNWCIYLLIFRTPLFLLQCSREKMPKHYKSNMIEHVKSIFNKIQEQDERLNKHELTLKENADHIKALDKRVGDLEKIANSQLIWRIEDYTRKLKEAKAGNTDTLFSPTFTTSKHGYRLCASVCLNGDGKGKGTHMSVFISVLKGRETSHNSPIILSPHCLMHQKAQKVVRRIRENLEIEKLHLLPRGMCRKNREGVPTGFGHLALFRFPFQPRKKTSFLLGQSFALKKKLRNKQHH